MNFSEAPKFREPLDSDLMMLLADACAQMRIDPWSDQKSERNLFQAQRKAIDFLIGNGEAGTSAVIKLLEGEDRQRALMAAELLVDAVVFDHTWKFAPDAARRILAALSKLEADQSIESRFSGSIAVLKRMFER